MPKLKPGTRIPGAKEDAAITKAARSDPDARPYSEKDWKKVKSSVRVGRPKSDSPKVFTGIRLDSEIVETFKATGKGWQTRMNAALREWLKTHSPG
jgi:uncharacterized protein (DUF4415 family)